MAIVSTDSRNYENIAEAIREESGSKLKYIPSEMPAAIRTIKTTWLKDNVISEDTVWSSLNVIKQTADRLTSPFQQKAPIVQGRLVSDYPMSVKSHIEPIQEGTGDPSPQNVQPIRGSTELKLVICGQNLAEDAERTVENIVSKPVLLKKGVRYKAVTNYSITSEDGNASISFRGNDTTSELVIEHTKQYVEYTPQKDRMAVVRVYSQGRKLTDKDKIQLLVQPDDGYFEAYKGNTITQKLPEEVFAGVYEWDTGVLTSTLNSAGESLSESKVFQLEKHTILAQPGITTVYSNSGDTEVTARKDPGAERRELEERIAALETAIAPKI